MSPLNVIHHTLSASSHRIRAAPAITNSTTLPAKGAAAKEVGPYTHGLTGVNVPLDNALTYTMWTCIAILLIIILVVRFGQMANAHLRHLLNLNAGALQQSYWSQDRTAIWPRLKKHLLYAPLWKKRHNREIQLSRAMNVGTIPSRLHTVILLMYLISNIVYCFCLDYKSPRAKILAEVRGRTGHLAIVNMAPLFVLAGRNSPFIVLLRVSFDTYNLFHRWIGRVVALQTLAHTLAWAINEYAANGMKGINHGLQKDPFLTYGLLGTIAMVTIMIQASSIIRHAFYEIFLHVHQLLAILTIVGIKMHCRLAVLPGEGYIDWVIALWVLERASRLLRLVYRNFSRRCVTKVTIEALPGQDTDACRVTINMARPWRYKPGSHLYIYIPSISFWMNHPFSIAWSETHDKYSLDSPSEKLPQRKSAVVDTTTPKTTTMSLIIAKRTGMTGRIFEKARAAPTGVITTYAMVEGPYGGLDSLHSYGTVVLFAAGVGITHQIGHIRDLLEGHAAGTVATQKIVLVWSVRTAESLEWVRPWMDQILQMGNRTQVLKVHLYVTKPRNPREATSKSETVKMYPGRCDPGLVLRKEVASRCGAMSVTVCGPGAFADEVRGAVREVVDTGATVDFVEESFTW